MADIAELGLRVRSDGVREATTQLDRLSKTAIRTETATVGLERNFQQVNRGAGSLGPTIQNASFQIQDFAVQVGGGTDAMRAFAQQFPQLVGGFGAYGAAIGAVVAVGAGLIPILLGNRDAAQDMGDSFDWLDDLTDGLQSSFEILNLNLLQLEEKFGQAAGRAREFAQFQAELRVAEANNALREQVSVLKDVADQYFSLSEIESGPSGFAQAYSQSIRRITQDFGLAGDAAREFEDLIQGLATADSLDDQVVALEEIQRLFDANAVSAADIPPEIAAALDEMIAYSLEVDAAKKITNDLTDASGEVGEALAITVGFAGDLKNELAASLALFNRISEQKSKEYSGRGGDPRDFMPGGSGAEYQNELEYKSPDEIIAELTPKVRARSGRKKAGGRSGGRSAVSEAERELESFTRTLERFQTEEQQAASDLAELEAGFTRFEGQLSPEQVALYGQAMTDLREEIANAGDGITEFGREAAAVFPTISSLMDDARNAASRLLETLGNRIFQRGLEGLFSGFGGGAKGGGLLGGAIIPGILHSGGIAGRDGYDHSRAVSPDVFAGAERYHNGGIAGLKPNEVPAILERGERVIPKGQSEPVRIELVNSGLTLSDGGQIMTQVDARVARGSQRTLERVPQLLRQQSNQGLMKNVRRNG